MTSCRDEILGALQRLERRHARRTFELSEIVAEVLAATDAYAEATIRTHVTSRMCVDAPDHHHTTFDELDRVGRGMWVGEVTPL